jgi:hypothetical protein|tara:strand:- start:835 stop:1005 length:171 start_codon:yes stop_codon:yes gene_type:complete
MKTRDELNTDINLAILEEMQKLNEITPVVDRATLKREAYKKLLNDGKGSSFGYSNG